METEHDLATRVMVQLPGRHDIKALFEKSTVLQGFQHHTPFLAFVVVGNLVDVHIVKHVAELVTYAPETQVLVQWRGEKRSDYFSFTVADVIAFTTHRIKPEDAVHD